MAIRAYARLLPNPLLSRRKRSRRFAIGLAVVATLALGALLSSAAVGRTQSGNAVGPPVPSQTEDPQYGILGWPGRHSADSDDFEEAGLEAMLEQGVLDPLAQESRVLLSGRIGDLDVVLVMHPTGGGSPGHTYAVASRATNPNDAEWSAHKIMDSLPPNTSAPVVVPLDSTRNEARDRCLVLASPGISALLIGPRRTRVNLTNGVAVLGRQDKSTVIALVGDGRAVYTGAVQC